MIGGVYPPLTPEKYAKNSAILAGQDACIMPVTYEPISKFGNGAYLPLYVLKTYANSKGSSTVPICSPFGSHGLEKSPFSPIYMGILSAMHMYARYMHIWLLFFSPSTFHTPWKQKTFLEPWDVRSRLIEGWVISPAGVGTASFDAFLIPQFLPFEVS